ncbi:26S proteasome subunit P45 [Mycena sanguinolenta]|uniref:26S proteasome subunit P45 n=1 Tax=Mycena sanguinolenta TaxID=230812 RepID=A0A8H6XSJ3_9AGAR|nr:26S proteasome subunit P45 [Mycena sanguinolenta]
MRPFSPLGLALSFFASVKAMTPAINAPAAGTHIAPGQTFDFSYQSIGDYCASAYDMTVYLFTSLPQDMMASETFATGHYFGRYSYPAPATLTMPDFSISPGGFGVGASVSNATFYLAVFEEYATCASAPGDRLSFIYNPVIYNATSD